MFNANVFGPLNTARSLLPYFRKQKHGTIVFMGSTGADIGTGPIAGAQFALRGMFIDECIFGGCPDSI